MTDKELVVAFQTGEGQVYDEIYRRFAGRIFGLCDKMLGNRLDAEEAMQETFLRAYQALGRFNGSYQLGPWLMRIASNVCVDALRSRGRVPTRLPLVIESETVEAQPGPEEQLVSSRQPRVAETIGQIQPLHARALKMRAEGLSHKEMAGHLAMSPNQVKSLLHRARSSFVRVWENASGWALAPILLLRDLLNRSRLTEAGLAPVPTLISAGVAERVAASAVIVALALGAPNAADPGTVTPGDQVQEKIARQATPPQALAERRAQHILVAEAPAKDETGGEAPGLQDVRELVGKNPPRAPDSPDPGPGDDGPGPSGSGSDPLAERVRDAVEKLLGD